MSFLAALLAAASVSGCKTGGATRTNCDDGTCRGSQRSNICMLWNKANRGGDDRLDIHCLRRRDIGVPAAALIEGRSSAVAALFFARDVGTPTNETYVLGDTKELPPLAEVSGELGLCSNEVFANHPRGARCSAVLVDHRTLLTAPHCWRTAEEMRIVFDFVMPPTGTPRTISVPEASVCRPARHPRFQKVEPGLALIDIECPDDFRRDPVEIAPAMPIRGNVYAIGFPLNLPAKFSGWGPVTPRDQHTFHAELDISPGNSGSPVFDEHHRLVGIVEADSSDDTCPSHNPSETCYRWASIPLNSGIELTITSIHSLKRALAQRALP